MAVLQTSYFTGMARTPLGHPVRKCETVTVLVTHTFNPTAMVAASDIL